MKKPIWDNVFKNGPGKIYGRQPLKCFYLNPLPHIMFLLESFAPYNAPTIKMKIKKKKKNESNIDSHLSNNDSFILIWTLTMLP